MDTMERLQRYCLDTFVGAWEDSPWGDSEDGLPHPVFKNSKGKIFVFCGERPAGGVTVTVKLPPEEGTAALGLPFVEVARYVGRYGWVTAVVSNETELEIVLGWVRASYNMVAPKKLRVPER
jgi:predicted DNA-binding protein (MmcQ/YjbR family)